MPGRYSVCGNCRRDVFWGGDRTSQGFKSEQDAASDKQRQAAQDQIERAEQVKREEQARIRKAQRQEQARKRKADWQRKREERRKHETYSGLVCVVAFIFCLTMELCFWSARVNTQGDPSDPILVAFFYGLHFATSAFFVMWRAIKDMRWALFGVFIGPTALAIIGTVLTFFGWPPISIWLPFGIVCMPVWTLLSVELITSMAKTAGNPG